MEGGWEGGRGRERGTDVLSREGSAFYWIDDEREGGKEGGREGGREGGGHVYIYLLARALSESLLVKV